MVNQTFAIMTLVFLEQNYINFFIEYHVQQGFNMIYVMVDDSTNFDEDYLIEDRFKPYVKLYYYSDLIKIEHAKNLIEKGVTKANILHETLMDNIYPLVNEDYVILLGIDSFLYLNNLKIDEYLKKHNISDDVAEIFFKWRVILNLEFKPKYNLLETLNTEKVKVYNHCHYFTLAKRSLVLKPHYNSHLFLTNGEAKGYCCGNNFTISQSDDFDKIRYQLLSINYDDNHSCILHYINRDFQNLIVKEVYYWQVNESDRKQNLLKLKYHISNLIKFRRELEFNANSLVENVSINNLFKPDPILEKNFINSEENFKYSIKESGVTKEELHIFLKQYINVDSDELTYLFD